MSLTKFAVAEILEVKGSDHRVHNASLEHLSDFSDYKTSDGYLYTRVRAISSRVNKNHDGWPSEELKKSYKTFLGKPIFVDHHNSNHKKTRGVIVDARIHVEEDIEKASAFDPYYSTAPENHKPPTWVELLLEVDAKTFPKLAKSIIAKEIDSVSMGCNVERSKCSICDNWATKPSEYCSHIRAKGSSFKVASEERLAYEDCYDIGFFEISYVFDPADVTALVSEVKSSSVKTSDINALLESVKQMFANGMPVPRIMAALESNGLDPTQAMGIIRMIDPTNAAPIDRTRMPFSSAFVDAFGNVHYADNPLPQSMQPKAPEHVETLRQVKPCPVCGSDMEDGRCDVCNFEEPPEGLNNPDIQKAQEVMEQQQQMGQGGPPPGADAGGGPPGAPGGGAPPAGQVPPQQMTGKVYRLSDYLDNYYQRPPEAHYDNEHNSVPCPACNGKGCTYCHDGGYLSPEEAQDVSTHMEAAGERRAEGMRDATNSNNSKTVRSERAAKINKNEQPVLPPTSRPSDNPKDVKVISNQARPVESNNKTERNMKYSKEQIEGFISQLLSRKIASSREDAIELIKAAMQRTAEGTQPSDPAGKPEQRVPVDAVGGFDAVTPQNFADQTVDVEGVGGFDNNPEADTQHEDVTKVQDAANSGPTKTWSGDSDQAKPVSPDTADGGPIGGPIKRGNLFPEDENFGKQIDVEKALGKEEVGPETGTWSDNKVNGQEQAKPVTNDDNPFIDVNLHSGRSRVLAALKVAEQEIYLGLLPEDEKYNRIEQLEQQSDEVLEARLDTLSMVKQAGLEKIETGVTARGILAAPRMARSAATESPTPRANTSQIIEDAAIFM